jgi:hypothetical protein
MKTYTTEQHFIGWQEFHQFSGCGGYGSGFGDSALLTLDLCDQNHPNPNTNREEP